MSSEKLDLKIIVLKRPYDTYTESSEMRRMLSEVFKLKLEGYLKYYQYGILPISDVDFIGDHILMCVKENGVYVPVSGFKSIKNSACKEFQIPFPIVQHKFGLHKDKFSNYVDGVNNWMKNLESQNLDFAYNLSWTIRPTLDKETRNVVRELTFALMNFHYEQEKINNVINSTAALRGINGHEEYMGMEYLVGGDGEKTGAFPSPTFFEQPFFIMHTKQSGFGEEFKKDCMKYYDLWNSRIIIGDKKIQEKKAA